MAETGEFAVDASVTPGWVLRRQPNDELADLDGGGGPSGPSVWLGPVPGDAAPVPAQQGIGGDDPTGTVRTGDSGGDGAEQGSVLISECRSVVVAA